jgi:hypothetical protein
VCIWRNKIIRKSIWTTTGHDHTNFNYTVFVNRTEATTFKHLFVNSIKRDKILDREWTLIPVKRITTKLTAWPDTAAKRRLHRSLVFISCYQNSNSGKFDRLLHYLSISLARKVIRGLIIRYAEVNTTGNIVIPKPKNTVFTVRCQVLTASCMKMIVFWDIA